MAKSKRDEQADEKGGDDAFQIPTFDEQAFIRREVQSARASFYAVGLGVLGGVVATAIQALGADWKLGWIALVASLALLQPLLKARGFGEDVTKAKAIAGSLFMVFFTGLSVWILGVNVV
jgi:hypothetical protein